jgi:hypothetical protein
MAADESFILTAAASKDRSLKGRVLPGGGGSSLIRRDEVLEVDVPLILETDDKHQTNTCPCLQGLALSKRHISRL